MDQRAARLGSGLAAAARQLRIGLLRDSRSQREDAVVVTSTGALSRRIDAVRRRLSRSSGVGPAAPDPVSAPPTSVPPEPGSHRPTEPEQVVPTVCSDTPVAGVVEGFAWDLVTGWISVPPEHPPVRVDLILDDLRVSSTWAAPMPDPSVVDAADRAGSAAAAAAAAAAPDPTIEIAAARSLGAIVEGGPTGGGRNSWLQIRRFTFRIRGVWAYAKTTSRLWVGIDATPLPIVGHRLSRSPARDGQHSPEDLRKRLAEGYVLSRFGEIQLSKRLDHEWQRKVLDLYDRVRRIVRDTRGYDVFAIYGTLLGAVREGGVISHDNDFDTAYVSRHRDGRAAAAELADIAVTLVEHGLTVALMWHTLHVHDVDDPSARVDLFHLLFDTEDHLRFPFGIAGTTLVRRDDWHGFVEARFGGGRVLVPADADALVEHIYGDDWQHPRPTFDWSVERTTRLFGSTTTAAERSRVYWANFYAHTAYTSGSPFAEFLLARPDTPPAVVDIGCGDGRDACAFGVSGRAVLGIDESVIGIGHAAQQAAALGVGERVRFQACDVADAARLRELLEAFRSETGNGPVLLYLRFFLHAIPEHVQEGLLEVLDAAARPGDGFAAEFRTEADARGAKVHGRHYRRFQDGQAFGRLLQDRYGFAIVHEQEGTGLSPYGDEDPVLYRVLARR